jgi:hypothetical protein
MDGAAVQMIGKAQPTEQDIFPVVNQEKLDKGLASYVRALTYALAKDGPFMKTMVLLDKRLASERIKAWLPQISGKEAEADRFLRHLTDSVLGSHIKTPMPQALIHFAVSLGPLSPQTLPDTKEFTTVECFDARRGTLQQCIVAPAEKAPSLDMMAITSGIIAQSQPIPVIVNRNEDNMPLFYAGGPGIFGERNKDSVLDGDDWSEGFGSFAGVPWPAYMLLYPQFLQQYHELFPSDPRINITHYPEEIREIDEFNERGAAALAATASMASAMAIAERQRMAAHQNQEHAREIEREARDQTEEARHIPEDISKRTRETEWGRHEVAEAAIGENALQAEERRAETINKNTAAAEEVAGTVSEAVEPRRSELPGEKETVHATSEAVTTDTAEKAESVEMITGLAAANEIGTQPFEAIDVSHTTSEPQTAAENPSPVVELPEGQGVETPAAAIAASERPPKLLPEQHEELPDVEVKEPDTEITVRTETTAVEAEDTQTEEATIADTTAAEDEAQVQRVGFFEEESQPPIHSHDGVHEAMIHGALEHAHEFGSPTNSVGSTAAFAALPYASSPPTAGVYAAPSTTRAKKPRSSTGRVKVAARNDSRAVANSLDSEKNTETVKRTQSRKGSGGGTRNPTQQKKQKIRELSDRLPKLTLDT